MKANDFQEWLKTTPEYQTLVFQHGERLFIQRDGEFENLTVRLAYRVWGKQQAIIDDLKAQLNNMEACYIEVKKQSDELQKTNISLEAGLRKNSKNKQRLLGKNIELQKRIDEALQEVKGLERFTGEDCIADFDVLQGAVSHACKRLEKTLRGDNA